MTSSSGTLRWYIIFFMHQNQEKTLAYFLYARKSSEDKDKQVQSIEDQVDRMSQLARELGLPVARVYTEEKTAKKPHVRPVFDEMMQRLQRGEANGILCWQANRLARNPIDAGTVSWLLQSGIIKSIRTFDREYLPADNVIVLAVEMGMANQFIVELRANVKRGLEKKVAKGWRPGKAPEGYLNSKKEIKGEQYICKDPERFPLVRQMFDLMLTGSYTPPHILELANETWGYRTRRYKGSGDKPLSRSGIYRILSNPFYAGLFTYKGVEYKGRHEPMLTLEEFERVQILLAKKGKPRIRDKAFTYAGLFHCGECSGMITAERKRKRIKSTGLIKEYTYYRCTHRQKDGAACSQRGALTEEGIEKQIVQILGRFTISRSFLKWVLEVLAESDKTQADESMSLYKMKCRTLESLRQEINELVRLRCRNLVAEDFFVQEKNGLERKVRQLEMDIRTPNAEENHVLVERAFRFAALAQERFPKADVRQKREIVRTIMQDNLSNQTIRDKKLSIHAAKWLRHLENVALPSKEKNGPIEPAETRMNTGDFAPFTPTCPRKSGIVDAIRTNLLESEHTLFVVDLDEK